MTYEDGRIEILKKEKHPYLRYCPLRFQARVDGKWLCDWSGGPISEYRTEEAALKAAQKRIGTALP